MTPINMLIAKKSWWK